MKLLVLGASGGCGSHLVKHALARGHEITAIVRADSSYEPPSVVTLLHDDVLREGAIAEAARGRDAIVSCLGIRRRHPRNPWSRLMSPANLTSHAASLIVAAAAAARIERVISISAAGVADSAPRMSWPLRLVFRLSQIGRTYRDLAAMEAVYSRSTLDWTAVRPVTLVDRPARGFGEVERFRLTATIPREAVALWMLDHLVGGGRPRTPIIGASS
jgi:putative NADH-flavin reductase